jgi:hypothetical protein
MLLEHLHHLWIHKAMIAESQMLSELDQQQLLH